MRESRYFRRNMPHLGWVIENSREDLAIVEKTKPKKWIDTKFK